MRTLSWTLDAHGVASVVFDAPDSPVNTMTAEWQDDLAQLVEQLEQDRHRIRGVLLASAKSTFFAGAELKGVLTLREDDAAACFARVESLKRSLRRLETLGRPVVALIEGAALGGGWEVALAAHARFALDDARLQLGTPEVTLGLMPGATGITKTVRLLGLLAAQPYLVEGKLFGPHEALALGLLQGLAADGQALRAAALAWIEANPQPLQPWDRKDHRIPAGLPSSAANAAALSVAPARLWRTTRGLYPAPQAVLEAMVEGAAVDYDTATRIESRKLAKLMVGGTTKNMVSTFFFDMNAIRSGRWRPRGVAPWVPAKVGVLGAGMMGAGIAHAAASRGLSCVLKDVHMDKARAGCERVREVLWPQVKQGRMTEVEMAEVLNRILPTDRLQDLQGSELIIEAVHEERELKASVTRQALPMLASGGFFASNTSTLPISGLAAASDRPQRFVGLHFFSPVHKMRLVEIVRGAQTDDQTLAHAHDFVVALGKVPIVVNDARGFFTSRVFGAYVMEGASMLSEGVGAPLIEHAALAAGMPVGPLAVLDETSLALSVQVLEQTRADLAAQGQVYRPDAGELLVERMVRQYGRTGRAAGAGFYDYPADGAKRLWPGLVEQFGRSRAVTPPVQALSQRLLYRQSIESVRCLSQGVLNSTAEANVGSILGIGFPAWTGGVIQFIASEGRDRFLGTADSLAQRHGQGYVLSAQDRAWIQAWRPGA